MAIGTFGKVTFESSTNKVRTFSGASRNGSGRWATHDVGGIKPATQFLGPGLEEISFEIKLSVSLGVNPSAEIDALRAMRDAGEYATLILAGKPIGKFSLDSVSETWDQVDNGGRILGATVSLKLREYREAK
jgi:phage protein U